MEWEHKCSLAWLQERQGHLTASEVRTLIPLTRTGRRRTITNEDYMRVFANKCVNLTEEDCWSHGAAARGHILEPYAIDALNDWLDAEGIDEEFFWWDDKLVVDGFRSLAFSPDAMDIPMIQVLPKPTALAEVKSYGAERHLTTACTPKNLIEERWQIATAMAVLDSIDHAYLTLFNPSMNDYRLIVIRFDRSELYSEIDTVLEAENEWDEFLKSVNLLYPHAGYGQDEELIVEEYIERQKLNP